MSVSIILQKYYKKFLYDDGRIERKPGEANFSSHRKVKTVLKMRR
jgi:hypothetical protein